MKTQPIDTHPKAEEVQIAFNTIRFRKHRIVDGLFSN